MTTTHQPGPYWTTIMVLSACWSLWVTSSQAGIVELTSPNPVNGGTFGGSWGWTYGLPDLNGDGQGELLVSAPWETVQEASGSVMQTYTEAGRVYVYDGATAQLLYSITSPKPASGAGFSGGSVAGDVDSDGVEDLMIPDEGSLAGVLNFFDGRNGEFLFALKSPSPSSPLGGFGFGAGKLDDVNGDGHFDWLVGEGRFSSGPGRIYVFSGATRTMLWMKAVAQLGWMGFGCRVLPDLNGDGAGEVAVGYPMQNVSQGGQTVSQAGYVTIFSGVNGAQLHRLTAPDAQAQDRFGERLQCIGDVDEDGVPDLVVGSHWGGPGDDGRAWVFSGASGAWIRTLSCPLNYPNGSFAWEVLPVPDQTGDGAMEVAILGAETSRAFIFDGATGAHLDTLQSPTGEGFWIGLTTNDGGVSLGSWVFAQGLAKSSGGVYLMSEHRFPPHLDIVPLGAGSQRLSYFGEMGAQYAVEGSRDFNGWLEIGTLPQPDGSKTLVLTNSEPARFFRLRAND